VPTHGYRRHIAYGCRTVSTSKSRSTSRDARTPPISRATVQVLPKSSRLTGPVAVKIANACAAVFLLAGEASAYARFAVRPDEDELVLQIVAVPDGRKIQAAPEECGQHAEVYVNRGLVWTHATGGVAHRRELFRAGG
jgi:hypothetical protein